jgi:hypothetical protein
MTKQEIVMPIIHTNGTSVEDLLLDNAEAKNAIDAALERIRRMEFNGRDYYPVPGSWTAALSQRMEIIKSLRDASKFFEAIAEHCADEMLKN